MVVNGDNKYSLERKKGQQDGNIPDWYSTQGYQLIKEKYLHEANPLEQYRLIARSAAKHIVEYLPNAEELFFQLLWSGKLSPSTPILANMGTTRGLPVSCSGGYIHDSIDGFYSSRRETAILTKYGFGTSSYLGDIRPRGSDISIGGKASGVLPVFKGFVRDMQEVAQGTQRRGAWAGYLPISHGDFDELCDYLHHSPDDLNVGWCISDNDIQLLNSGDLETLRRYQKILKVKLITGKGYFFFTDKVNRHRPDSYINNNLDIKASNLCVAPETLILTDKGHIRIDTLEGRKVNVWNGHEWSNVEVVKTGVDQKLIRVSTTGGHVLDCTPYHKFYVLENSLLVEKRANELSVGDLVPQDNPNNLVRISAVEDLDRTDDTYCFSEPKRHMGVFNGLLTGQCTEITLNSSQDDTFTCILSSLNLAHYDTITEDDVINAIIFLHCVGLEFIDKAKNIPGLEKAVDFTRKGMALGLGQCGFHTLLQSKSIPFESLEAQFLNTKIAKFIWEQSEKASRYLARIFGEPTWCEDTGLANTHRIAIAPTKSTALIMGGVSEGIAPDPAMVYTQLTSAGEVERIAPEFLKLLRVKGKYNKDTIQSIVDAFGSVQHLDFLTEHEKLVFRTAFEIDQHVVLRLAAQRQKYIDQAQSINLYFGGDATEEYISSVHKAAFLNEDILTLYYCYSKTGVSGSKGECISCQ